MPDVYIISYIAASLFLHQIEAIIVCLLSYYPTVGRQLVVCQPTVDRQLADRFFGELFFTITPITPLFAENLAPLT